MRVSSLWNRSNFLFFGMFGVVSLLNVNYAILRSARNALAVADLGGGAWSIPWFELFGTMPGAVLMTLGLTWLLKRYPIQRVFLIVLTAFVSFFIFFAGVIYPVLPTLQTALTHGRWIVQSETLASFLPWLFSMLYFVMAELWKVALFTVLFLGMVNQYIPVEQAKRYYGPLMLGASAGTIAASPLIKFCTSDLVSGGSWSVSLVWMMGALTILSLAIGWLFSHLWRSLDSTAVSTLPKDLQVAKAHQESLSFWENLRICCRSRYLLLLAWVTIADYVAYALGEILFLDLLKQKYPDPRAYCDFMGQLQLVSGLLTAVSAIFLTPYLLRHFRWVVASLVTPVCLLLTEGSFFFALWHPGLATQLELLVVLGTLFFCLVRAAKYTLFDASKEISFILLPPLEKIQGKLVVDGMCSRLGRGGGSFLTVMFVQISGSVLASAPLAGAVALFIASSCVLATWRLGSLVDKRSPEPFSSPPSP